MFRSDACQTPKKDGLRGLSIFSSLWKRLDDRVTVRNQNVRSTMSSRYEAEINLWIRSIQFYFQ